VQVFRDKSKKNGIRCAKETDEKDYSVQTKNAECSDQEKAFPDSSFLISDSSFLIPDSSFLIPDS